MSPKPINSRNFKNPFLTEERKELWKRIEQNARPISKEELRKQAMEAKSRYSKGDK